MKSKEPQGTYPPIVEGARLKLLVAEDDKEMRQVLSKTLSREGFEVRTAGNGEEALALIEREPGIRILVSDIRMPVKTGEQLLEELKRARPDIRVIFITGYGELDQYASLMKQGAFDYVTKPFKIPDLLAVLEKAVASLEPDNE